MLDVAIELAAAGGAHEVVVGIAHRGRLNVLAHTVGRSYASILREFEGERTIDALVSDPEGGTGDVKYHLAASETRHDASGDIQVTLAANPSHLEAVDPVIEGHARAEQTDRSRGAGIHDPSVALAILIHGDASFAGRASLPRRSTSTRSTATRPAARSTSSRTTRSASRPIPPRGAPRATRATSPRASTSPSSTSTPTIPRPRSRRFGSRSRTARSSATTSSSISSAIAASATTSRTSLRTRSRCMTEQIDAQPPGSRDVREASRRGGSADRGRGGQLLEQTARHAPRGARPAARVVPRARPAP